MCSVLECNKKTINTSFQYKYWDESRVLDRLGIDETDFSEIC